MGPFIIYRGVDNEKNWFLVQKMFLLNLKVNGKNHLPNNFQFENKFTQPLA